MIQRLVSLSLVCVVLLNDFTLFSTEILLSQVHIVTGKVNMILTIVWMFGNITLLDCFNAVRNVVDTIGAFFQNVYKHKNG